MSKSTVHDAAAARRTEPVVITAAEPSYDEQLKARRKRYMLTMSMRFPLLIGAVILYHHIWLSIPLLLISIPLPWVAVLLANDRPARNRKQRAPLAGVINYERQLSSARTDVIEGE